MTTPNPPSRARRCCRPPARREVRRWPVRIRRPGGVRGGFSSTRSSARSSARRRSTPRSSAPSSVSVWYGGLGPGLVTTALAWLLGLWLVVEPRGDLAIEGAAEMTRWAASLAIAVGLILVMASMRRDRERAAEAAVVAAASIHNLEALRELSSKLLAAATVSEVGRTLIEGTTGLLGAKAVALGFVEGAEPRHRPAARCRPRARVSGFPCPTGGLSPGRRRRGR